MKVVKSIIIFWTIIIIFNWKDLETTIYCMTEIGGLISGATKHIVDITHNHNYNQDNNRKIYDCNGNTYVIQNSYNTNHEISGVYMVMVIYMFHIMQVIIEVYGIKYLLIIKSIIIN